MTALIIIGSILFLLLLLLCSKISVEVLAREGEVTLRVRYLLLRLTLLPAREKSEKQLAKQRQRQEKRDKKKQTKQTKRKREKQTLRELLDLVKKLVLGSRKGVRTLRRHLVFSRVRVLVAVGGDDAHEVAMSYGRLCLLAAAALDVVGVLFVLKKPHVVIRPNFTATCTRYEIGARASIRPVYLLAAGLRILFPLVGILLKSQEKAVEPAGEKPLAKTA